MDDLITIFLILIFFVLPLIESLLKKGKQGKQGKPQRPSRDEQQRKRTELDERIRRHQQSRQRTEREAEPISANDSATDMIPADLWEVLTGQPHPQRRTPEEAPERFEPVEYETERYETEPDEGSPYEPSPYAPTPYEPTQYPPEVERETVAAEEIGTRPKRIRLGDEASSARDRGIAERSRKRRGVQTLDTVRPVVVSMETAPLPAELRHDLFHQKLDALPRPAGSDRGVRQAALRAALIGDLSRKDSLRRAFLLKEVLGPPRGLEDD